MAEAMRRQIITPLCLLIVAVMTVQGIADNGMARRDRRPSERRGSPKTSCRPEGSLQLRLEKIGASSILSPELPAQRMRTGLYR